LRISGRQQLGPLPPPHPEVRMKARVLALVLATVWLGAAAQAEQVTYRVTVEGTWTATSHPHEYPADAHFSWLTGATHDDGYRLFEAPGIATAGLEALAEDGELTPYDAEIQAAIDQGSAGALFQARPIEIMPGTTTFEVTLDERHPLISLVTMIAPSSDWFTGVADVRLFENGAWLAEKSLALEAWDAGTDSGATFTSPDADTMPRQSVRLLDSEHFAPDGKVVPVGTVTFKRL
jgi:Spondin_N